MDPSFNSMVNISKIHALTCPGEWAEVDMHTMSMCVPGCVMHTMCDWSPVLIKLAASRCLGLPVRAGLLYTYQEDSRCGMHAY